MTLTKDNALAVAERAQELAPTGDRRPVELAVVDSIAGGFEPETWLAVTFPRPDGGLRVRWTWTDGGAELGDRIDDLALSLALDAADTFHLTDLHVRVSYRGRIKVAAHPLRPILADIQAGVRAPDERRAQIRRFIDVAAEQTGQTPRPGIPRWMGVGPNLLNRKKV